MSVHVSVEIFGVLTLRLKAEGRNTILDMKQLVDQATGIDHKQIVMNYGKVKSNMETLGDDKTLDLYACPDNGITQITLTMTSPTVLGLQTVKGIQMLQKEAEADERQKQKGEMTITPDYVYLTCQGDWETPSSSEPAYRQTLKILHERIETLETEVKEKKNAIKDIVKQIREVRIPIELRQPSGNMIPIFVAPCQKVLECKKFEVSPALGVPPDQIRLLCGHELMRDGKHLFSYNVEEGTILDCIKINTKPVVDTESSEVDTPKIVKERDDAMQEQDVLAAPNDNEICVRVIFDDLREEHEPCYGGFAVMTDKTLSPVSLNVKIIEEYNQRDFQLKQFLDLSNLDFKTISFFNEKPLVAGDSIKSLEALGIHHLSVVHVRLYHLDDPRFVKIWEEATGEKVPEEKLNEDEDIFLGNASKENCDGKFIVKSPEEIGVKFNVYFAKDSQAKELFRALEDDFGYEKNAWRVQWQNVEGKSFLQGHETLSTYVGKDTVMHLVPVLLGGAKINLIKSMKKKPQFTKQVDGNGVFDLAKKVTGWNSVAYDGFMNSLSKEDLEMMLIIFTKGKTHLDLRVKKMAEVAMEIKQFTEAINQLERSKEHLRELVFQAFAEKFADANGEVETSAIKKNIEFYIGLKEIGVKEQEKKDEDENMDGWADTQSLLVTETEENEEMIISSFLKANLNDPKWKNDHFIIWTSWWS